MQATRIVNLKPATVNVTDPRTAFSTSIQAYLIIPQSLLHHLNWHCKDKVSFHSAMIRPTPLLTCRVSMEGHCAADDPLLPCEAMQSHAKLLLV